MLRKSVFKLVILTIKFMIFELSMKILKLETMNVSDHDFKTVLLLFYQRIFVIQLLKGLESTKERNDCPGACPGNQSSNCPIN